VDVSAQRKYALSCDSKVGPNVFAPGIYAMACFKKAPLAPRPFLVLVFFEHHPARRITRTQTSGKQ